MADGMMHRNLGLCACENHKPFIKMLTNVLKVPEGGREGVETPGLPEGNLSRKSWSRKDAPHRGVIHTECSYRHAAGQEIKFIQIERGMQSLSEFYKRYLEHELVKVGHATDLSWTAGWAWDPSQVLGAGGKPSTWLPPGKTRRAH